MSETIECPYCEAFVEIEPSEREHYEGYEEYSCSNCGKNFEVYAEPTIHYSSCGKADCLNGGEHRWKQKIGYPEAYFKGRYYCLDCSAEKVVKGE